MSFRIKRGKFRRTSIVKVQDKDIEASNFQHFISFCGYTQGVSKRFKDHIWHWGKVEVDKITGAWVGNLRMFWMDRSLSMSSERAMDLSSIGKHPRFTSIQASTSATLTAFASGKARSQARAMASHSWAWSVWPAGFWSEPLGSSAGVRSASFDMSCPPRLPAGRLRRRGISRTVITARELIPLHQKGRETTPSMWSRKHMFELRGFVTSCARIWRSDRGFPVAAGPRSTEPVNPRAVMLARAWGPYSKPSTMAQKISPGPTRVRPRHPSWESKLSHLRDPRNLLKTVKSCVRIKMIDIRDGYI